MVTTKSALAIDRQVCPVCQSQKREILFSAKHDSPGFIDFIKYEAYFGKAFYDAYNNGPARDLLFEIAECSNCHFYYLTEVLNDEGMGLLYNEWLDKEMLKEHYKKLPYSPYQEHMLGLLKKRYLNVQQPKLMDFGAGYGVFCGMSVKKGFETYAFDLSNDKNDYMDSMGVTIINNLKNYKKFFHVIWVNQVFEHVADPLSIVKELRESLADDGLIYLAVPDCTNLKPILKEKGLSPELFRLLCPHQHVNAFTNSTLKLLGINAGLQPLGMSDYMALFNTKLNIPELKLLVKKTIKNSSASTGLLFKKK